jgi:hypothetical protein
MLASQMQGTSYEGATAAIRYEVETHQNNIRHSMKRLLVICIQLEEIVSETSVINL